MAIKRATGDLRRSQRVRSKLRKVAANRVRMSVHRSGKHIYVQLIDDRKGVTLAAASTTEKELRGKLKSGATVEASTAVGELIAKRAKDANIEHIVFDRGSYLFHGRVKAVADAARAAGLNF